MVFGDGGEESVGGRVEGGFDGVLDDADDEADGDGLHGDVVADAEEGAGHRDEEEGAAGHPGGAAGAEGGDQRQE